MYTPLESIKHKILNLPCISFEQYYMKYVLDVQDSCIDQEVQEMISKANGNLISIERQIAEEQKTLERSTC